MNKKNKGTTQQEGKNHGVIYITQGATIAALYVVLTVFINAFNLASGAIQVRISEAMTILPVFTPAAVPGLAIGCFLANTVTGCHILDIIFGTLATLIGAIGTRLLRKTKVLCYLPPIISNALIVPYVLIHAYNMTEVEIPFLPESITGSISIYWLFALTVGIGELISAGVLGFIMRTVISRYGKRLFSES